MMQGFLFALSACFVWGLIFIIPSFIEEFSALEVMLGRYFSYGLLSSCLFFRKGFSGRLSFKAWKMALIFSFASNIFYYMGVLLGLRFASAPLTVLVIGMCPLALAFYGNLHTREVSYKKLIVPSLWMVFGLILVNGTEVDWTFQTYTLGDYLLGMFGAVAAVFSWSWYAVENARFLKANPEIGGSQWSTVLGVATLFWVLALGLLFSFGPIKQIDIAKIFAGNDASIRYLVCSLVLGFVCSWVGSYLWNKASTRLPFSLLGPFLLFETLFGLLFVFLFEASVPGALEMVGISSLLGGITLCILQFRKSKKSASP